MSENKVRKQSNKIIIGLTQSESKINKRNMKA